MKTFIQALLEGKKTAWGRTQYLTIIENGISLINDKCNQACNNSAVLDILINSEYEILNRLVGKGDVFRYAKTPNIQIQKGIATWNNHNRMLEYMVQKDVYVGIAVTSFPDVPGEFFDEAKHQLSKYKTGAEKRLAQKIKIMIKKDRFEELYDFLKTTPPKDSPLDTSGLRGFFTERSLYWLVRKSAEKIDEKRTNVFGNTRSWRPELQYDDKSSIKYGLPFEIDVLLHSNNKNTSRKILRNLWSESIIVYFKENANHINCKYVNN